MSASTSPASASRPPQPLVASLGMFIIDTFLYLDPLTGSSLGDGGKGSALGGGGLYFAIGARVWLRPGQVRMVIDRGEDFERGWQRRLDVFDGERGEGGADGGTGGMWAWRERKDGMTTKAVNVYKGDFRSFNYLTPKLRLDPHDLILPSPCDSPSHSTNPPLLPEWLHCICAPQRAMEILDEIDEIDAKGKAKEGRRTKVCWEPIPDSALPENLEDCLRVMRRVDVFSPNHEEAASFLSIPADLVSVPSPLTSAAQGAAVRQAHLKHLARGFKTRYDAMQSGEASEASRRRCPLIVIRGGAAGSCALYERPPESGKLVEADVPAYHTAESASKVVDVTGGGNSYLGGLTAWLATHDKPVTAASEDEVRTWLRGALASGGVSASFAIEQLALPHLETSSSEGGLGGETWNGDRPQRRLEELLARP